MKVKNILKDIVFVILTVSILLSVNQILVKKKTYRNTPWPSTSTYEQFYNMDENSIDVLFLGSSYAMNAFIPQEIYNEYEYTSYNLASEQQSIFTSYYWLKEALNYQSPKVVVLETRFAFEMHPESSLNTTEGLLRSAFDPMKSTSKVKWEAVNEICSYDDSQSVLSYYLTNIRFHSRYQDLEDVDFDSSLVSSAQLFGYAPNFNNHITEYEPFVSTDTSVYETFYDNMEYYLDRIVELCDENDIELLLVSVPSSNMTDGIHNTLTAYAEEHNVTYYDFSEETLYSSLGTEMPQESAVDHENLLGARKMSLAIGTALTMTHKIDPVTDTQYESNKEFYEAMIKDANLVTETDLNTYITMLNEEHLSVFISVKKDMCGALEESTMNALASIGLTADFHGQYYQSYYAALNGNVLESRSSETVSVTGSTADGYSVYSISSSGKDAGNLSSITIDGEEYSMNDDGINIVVYDNLLHKVIDSVNLDTSSTKTLTHMETLPNW